MVQISNIEINFRNILLRYVFTDIRRVPKTVLSTDCTIKTNTTCEECLIDVSVRYNRLLLTVNNCGHQPANPQTAIISQTQSNVCNVFQCLWCISSRTCMEYPVKSILPSHGVCALSEARWGVCWSKTDNHIQQDISSPFNGGLSYAFVMR